MNARDMYYFDGSTARKIEAAPERRERPTNVPSEREYQRRKASAKVSARADKALAFDLSYTIFVVTAVGIMIAACLAMLYMESKLSNQKKNINVLKTELEQIQDANLAMEVAMDDMYTLDEIYDVATNELGMVYAKKGQVIYYNGANEDYVKQYTDVPEVN